MFRKIYAAAKLTISTTRWQTGWEWDSESERRQTWHLVCTRHITRRNPPEGENARMFVLLKRVREKDWTVWRIEELLVSSVDVYGVGYDDANCASNNNNAKKGKVCNTFCCFQKNEFSLRRTTSTTLFARYPTTHNLALTHTHTCDHVEIMKVVARKLRQNTHNFICRYLVLGLATIRFLMRLFVCFKFYAIFVWSCALPFAAELRTSA